MKIEKIITTLEPQELEITGITLLSKEEYEACEEHIAPRNFWWWLRSPSSSSDDIAACVYDEGYVDSIYVYSSRVGVSPALQICNLESSNLKIGDRFKLKGQTWTVVSEGYALCDDNIGYHCFRENWRASDANVYEKSDVKKFVEEWWGRKDD